MTHGNPGRFCLHCKSNLMHAIGTVNDETKLLFGLVWVWYVCNCFAPKAGLRGVNMRAHSEQHFN